MEKLQEIIEKAWGNRDLLKDATVQNAIREVVDLLDKGKLRVLNQQKMVGKSMVG